MAEAETETDRAEQGEKHQQQMKFKAAMLSGDITPYILRETS